MAPPHAPATQEKIILAAGSLFADLGYEIVSLREIAAEAGVHFSAINYHFGSKEKLYAEVLRTAATSAPLEAYIQQNAGSVKEPARQLGEIARSQAKLEEVLAEVRAGQGDFSIACRYRRATDPTFNSSRFWYLPCFGHLWVNP